MPSKLYLDTNIFCATFEGDGRTNEELRTVFRLLRRKPKAAVTSEFTLAELLGAKSPSLEWNEQKRLYSDLLVPTGFIELHPVSREILIATGDYRQAARAMQKTVRLPDAIHAVTAVRSGCKYIVTSDNRFVAPDHLEKVAPDTAGLVFLKSLLDA